MNYSTLSSFANLDYPKGIDSWLHRFEKPLSRVEEGTDRNPDVEHIQNVCLDPIVQQNCRQVYQMCHVFMRAGHMSNQTCLKSSSCRPGCKSSSWNSKGFLRKMIPPRFSRNYQPKPALTFLRSTWSLSGTISLPPASQESRGVDVPWFSRPTTILPAQI